MYGTVRTVVWADGRGNPPSDPIIKCEVERDPDETGGMKSRVHPKYKTKYRVRNWASYERALIGRGNITIWLSPAAIAAWKPEGTRTRGAPPKYSDLAIETALDAASPLPSAAPSGGRLSHLTLPSDGP